LHCAFTLDHYKEIIELAKDNSYLICPVKDYSNQRKVILLRHDIDFSLEYAYELANVEYDLGVCSSYYVYLHSELYNALSPKSMGMLRAMKEMGHEIGLHYDSNHYMAFEDEMLRYWLYQQDNKIDTLTMTQHFPASNKKMTYFKDPNDLPIKYIADSGRNWREKCICQWIGKQDRLHVNIHPEWWVGGIDRWDALNKMYQSYESSLARNMTDVRDMLRDYEVALKL
jgi:hypothetical protein